MCLYPTLIKNRKYVKNKKNGGVVPPVPDERVRYVPIGCQDCIECRKQKARQWQVRLLEDLKEHKNGRFITLTFSNESIVKFIENTDNLKELEHLKELSGYPLDNEIATKAVRLFLERWRKKFKKPLRHWLVTELGHNGTENIHIHGIIWTDVDLRIVEQVWGYGYMWKGKKQTYKNSRGTVTSKIENYVNERTVNYIIKYITKRDIDHPGFKSKILTSAGIGGNYVRGTDYKRNKYNGKNTIEYYKSRTGHKIAMPIYWRNKIYSEKEREQLWLIKLDKQERWICGEKIDIRKGEEEYWKLLKWYQKRSEKLGYGNGMKTWEQEVYEKQRREMQNAKRIEKVREKNNNKNTATAGPAKVAYAPNVGGQSQYREIIDFPNTQRQRE